VRFTEASFGAGGAPHGTVRETFRLSAGARGPRA
jgi:hypothetical protein